MEDDGVVGACGMHGEIRNAYNILSGNSER
jgi:hypothetical protein